MVDVSRSRGRPRKDPEEKRSEHLTTHLSPSEREIIEQEATRCGSTLTHVVRTFALETLEPQGRSLPLPEVADWLLYVADRMRNIAVTLEEAEFQDELSDLSGVLSERTSKIQRMREVRENLREKAPKEPVEEAVRLRVTPRRKSWLEKRAAEEDTTLSSLLRASCLQGIQENEKFQTTESLLEKWSRWTKGIAAGKATQPAKDAGTEFAARIEHTIETKFM